MIISDILTYQVDTVNTLTLSDGTKIKNLGLNGNNLVSSTKLTPDMFEGKLSHIILTGNVSGSHEFHDCELVQIMEFEGQWLLLIATIPEEELRLRKLESDQMYIAMMADVEL